MTHDFELRLISAIQPVRHFFLAQVLEFAMTSGLLEALDDTGEAKTGDLAARLGMDAGRLTGLLRYLAAEGVVTGPEDRPALTAKGREYLAFRPWYELLIGGYGATLLELPQVMADRGAFASRNGTMVGRGSCGISRYDAIPLVRRLLATLPTPPDAVVDLGCGDGTFLLDLCADGIRGVGPTRTPATSRGPGSPPPDAVSTARSSSSWPPPRTTWPGSRAGRRALLPDRLLAPGGAGAAGREATKEVVRKAITCAPGARLAIVEVDHRPLDPGVTRHGLGLAYYNPYYLLHQITEQRLEPPRLLGEPHRRGRGRGRRMPHHRCRRRLHRPGAGVPRPRRKRVRAAGRPNTIPPSSRREPPCP